MLDKQKQFKLFVYKNNKQNNTIMLSYIKRKISESDSNSATTEVPNISSKIKDMSLEVETGTDAMEMTEEEALLRELGYKNATELQETVYGIFLKIPAI